MEYCKLKEINMWDILYFLFQDAIFYPVMLILLILLLISKIVEYWGSDIAALVRKRFGK